MKIAVLSGKGGTGKTFVSVNLASVAPASIYVDCDVEEPNGHLFFKPQDLDLEHVTVKVPHFNKELCSGCRICLEFCKFNALAYINEELFINANICHSCGGCLLLCPEKALSEKDKVIGSIKKGISENVRIMTGTLNTGVASGVPIITKLLEGIPEDSEYVFIDCPPGSACVVMESIKEVDFCILVAEPTIFGVHNLSMVYELVKLFNKPFGVILNKCLDGENPAEQFCIQNKIKVLEKISFDNELGTLNSNALIAAREKPYYRDLFAAILNEAEKEVLHETVINT